jgi:hypothetical protein
VKGAIYKGSAMVTFVCGAALHSTNLALGPDRLVREVFTPSVEIFFAALMIFTSIAGWSVWKKFEGSRFTRVFYGFTLVFITLSIPIHVRSVVTWSTRWVHAFPRWYSVAEVPLFVVLTWGVSRLRFAEEVR